jgi:hypothetical protein
MRTAFACIALFVLSAGAAAAQIGNPSVETITVSPRLPTTLDPLRVTVTGLGICGAYAQPDIFPPEISGNRIVLRVFSSNICSPPGLAPFSLELPLGPLPAGTWTVAAVIDEEDPFEKTLEVDPASTSLLLQDGLFSVSVQWSTPDGALHGEAQVVPLSKESGYLWFFQGSNPEIMVKILDGRPVNGNWWVFISSNTNLEFRVHVRTRIESDPPFDHEEIYVSPAGANKNFIDTTSFRGN